MHWSFDCSGLAEEVLQTGSGDRKPLHLTRHWQKARVEAEQPQKNDETPYYPGQDWRWQDHLIPVARFQPLLSRHQTFSLGRAPPDFDPLVLLRDGGANSEVVDWVLAGWAIDREVGGGGLLLGGGLISGEPSVS